MLHYKRHLVVHTVSSSYIADGLSIFQLSFDKFSFLKSIKMFLVSDIVMIIYVEKIQTNAKWELGSVGLSVTHRK